jgi:MFS family permease
MLLLTGLSILAVFSSIMALVQLSAPENMRGRIMSVYNTAFRGSMALGPAAAGYFSRDEFGFGAPAVIAFNGALMMAAAIWFLARNKDVREL